VAVAVIHGIGKQDANFADALKMELTDRFAAELPRSVANPHKQIVIEPIYWAPVLQKEEETLWKRLKRTGDLNFIKLRQFMVEFGADALAYQPLPGRRSVYDAVHGLIARGLSNLAQTAGPNAPLCIIAHSLGSVMASNYLYDLQKGFNTLPQSVRDFHTQTPLEMGHTFAFFYTLGSPIALWSLRYTNFGKPIDVPAPELPTHYPTLKGEWINYYDPDDVIGYPLRPLNADYRRVVKKDVAVNVGSILTSWNPLSHTEYWTDNDITIPIAKALAQAWETVNP
jgi:hypothetical protein